MRATAESSPARPEISPEHPALASRLASVDLLRGLVMVLMALDHTRDFFTSASFNPLDLEQTTPAWFFTRWITHICAPVFVLLAGVSAFLFTQRGKTIRDLSRFLVTRGLWLILLELTYMNWFGWRFGVNIHGYGLQVIWLLGWSMIVLAGLVWLPRRAILAIGLVLITCHNAYDGIKPDDTGPASILWRLLHVAGDFNLGDVHVSVGYPLIPGMGVMACGYAFAPVLLFDAPRRRKWLLLTGGILTALFFVLRTWNHYGDPTPWGPQSSLSFTVLSFLNCNKYPPSLCFLLITLGPALLLLAWFDRGTPKWLRPLLIFGRVPLFFYLLHLPVTHAVSMLAMRLRAPTGTDAGFELMSVYLMWLAIVAALYPVCHWFAGIKQQRRSAWLSYL